MCILSSPSDLWVPQNATREEDLVAGEWVVLSGISRLTTHHHPGILQVATVLAFLPKLTEIFLEPGRVFSAELVHTRGWHAGMFPMLLPQREARQSDSQKVPWDSRAKQATSSQPWPSASWGRGCTCLHSYHLLPPRLRWSHREGPSMFQIWVVLF